MTMKNYLGADGVSYPAAFERIRVRGHWLTGEQQAYVEGLNSFFRQQELWSRVALLSWASPYLVSGFDAYLGTSLS